MTEEVVGESFTEKLPVNVCFTSCLLFFYVVFSLLKKIEDLDHPDRISLCIHTHAYTQIIELKILIFYY